MAEYVVSTNIHFLTLNKMAPERPLSRMAIEILCPCLVWELALFCAAPQVPDL
jgi:hypothetical protein